MMRVFIGLSLSLTACWAQPAIDTLWSVYPGQNHESEFFYEMLELDDGSFVFAGGLYSADSGRIIDAVYKQGADGANLWSNGFHGIGLGWFKGICETGDGGFILTGQTRIPDQPGETDIYAARVDQNGDSLWTRVYGKNLQDESEAVYPAADGNYWIFGRTREGAYDQFLMMKISANGDSLESHTYGGERSDYLWEAAPTSDGGFILAGSYWDTGIGYLQGMLVKTDAEGDSVWGRRFSGGDDIEFLNVAVDPAGGYIACGTISIGDAEEDWFLMKVSEDGDSLWSRRFGGAFQDLATVVLPVYGGYAMAGLTNSFGEGQSDAYILRTDENGDSLFSQTFGSSMQENVNDLLQTDDLGYVICGSGNLAGLGRDAWLLKTTPDPTNVPPAGHERLLPLDDTTIDASTTSEIVFVWSSASDANDDGVTYRFEAEVTEGAVLLDPAVVETTDTTVTVGISIPLDQLDELATVEWTVWATDGEDSTEAVNGSGELRVEYPGDASVDPSLPLEYSLVVYPNPFNAVTKISFTLPVAGRATLEVFDVMGRTVESLTAKLYSAGTYSIEFDGAGLPSGMYPVRLSGVDHTKSVKLLLLK